MNKELSRHEIRVMAVQALFPLDFNQDLTKQDAILHAIELEHEHLLDEEQTHFIPKYLDLLVTGVCEHREDLDEKIASRLKKGWSLKRLSKMDVIILRIALFEMLYVDNVPNKVAVNEALELAKTFSDDQSRKFINGILSAINNDLEQVESN